MVLFLFSAGCVSIYDDKVQVQRPAEMEAYQRNILDKCTPHTLPHRLITGTMNIATTVLLGSPLAFDQATFDHYWSNVAPDLTGGATANDLKPVINWEIQAVRFVTAVLSNHCEKVKAYGMETDCYQISFLLYKYVEGIGCNSPPTRYPVFVFIYPRSNLPTNPKWLTEPYSTPTPAP